MFVSLSFVEVSAHSAPGKLPILMKLSRAIFQEAESKDPAQQEEAKSLLMCEMTKHLSKYMQLKSLLKTSVNLFVTTYKECTTS